MPWVDLTFTTEVGFQQSLGGSGKGGEGNSRVWTKTRATDSLGKVFWGSNVKAFKSRIGV